MKGNGKKLAVFVIVAALAVFMAVATASADPKDDHALKGQYAFSGPGHCVVSPAGFGDNYTPNVPDIVFASSQIWEGVYTFNRDGTGSATAIIRSLSAPDAQGKVTASSVTAEMTFTYEVTKEGDITFGYPNHGNKVNRGQWWMQWDAGPSHGVISPDGKTMTITCGPPVQLTVVDVGGTNAPNLVGTTAYCVTTLSGMRIK